MVASMRNQIAVTPGAARATSAATRPRRREAAGRRGAGRGRWQRHPVPVAATREAWRTSPSRTRAPDWRGADRARRRPALPTAAPLPAGRKKRRARLGKRGQAAVRRWCDTAVRRRSGGGHERRQQGGQRAVQTAVRRRPGGGHVAGDGGDERAWGAAVGWGAERAWAGAVGRGLGLERDAKAAPPDEGEVDVEEAHELHGDLHRRGEAGPARLRLGLRSRLGAVTRRLCTRRSHTPVTRADSAHGGHARWPHRGCNGGHMAVTRRSHGAEARLVLVEGFACKRSECHRRQGERSHGG